MKISVDIDCTPEEARRFLGLPDLQPIQQAVLQEMEARLKEATRSMDPEALWRLWMPTAQQGMEQISRFWQQFAGGAGSGGAPGGTPGRGKEGP